MNERTLLTRRAIRLALATRRDSGYSPADCVCIVDLAGKCGVEVRFVALPSLEGMYASTASGVIILSSLRSLGRQAFTCAHELGHHVFHHGTRWDEYLAEDSKPRRWDPHEWEADRFASYILMPKRAVLSCFSRRKWPCSNCEPRQAYVVSTELGVSYEALVTQMSKSLRLLEHSHVRDLLHSSPKSIRASLLGTDCPENIVVVDPHWSRKTTDVLVGDFVLFLMDVTVEGASLERVERSGKGLLFRGAAVGISQVHGANDGWAAFVRVARPEYAGCAQFRHLEDTDDR